ncbi:MAG: SET domain-containing protein-lysine N-methyltransferase [Pseudomonadota bacterium]
MQHIQSIIRSINDKIFQDNKALDKKTVLILTSTYECSKFLCAVSAQHQSLNLFLAHCHQLHFNLQALRSARAHVILFGKILTKNPLSLSQICLGTGGSILGAAKIIVHKAVKFQDAIKKLKALETGIDRVFDGKILGDYTPPAPTQRKKCDNYASVQEHRYIDEAPLYVNMYDRKTAVYHPKTVVKVAGLSEVTDDPKLAERMIKSMNEFLALSIKERVEYIDYYTEVRKITKKDCKNDNLNKIMMGQNGVFARRDLKKYLFLGFYSGCLIESNEEKQQHADEIGYSNYSTYLFGFNKQKIPVVSGFQYGNRWSLVNSPTTYEGTLREIARDLLTKRNISALYGRTLEYHSEEHKNNPDNMDLVGYLTTEKVKKNAQLYIDYGRQYWRNKAENYLECTLDELADAIDDYARQMHMSNLRKMHSKKHHKRK